MSGIGGTIVDNPSMRKEKDELAGKFRFGKTILVTDLNYKCYSNSRGTTNIQYGLDDLGFVVTVIDINSFKSVTRAQKFLDAVEHLIKGVMPDIATEENVRRGDPKRRQDGDKTDLCIALQGPKVSWYPIRHSGRRHGLSRHPEELWNHGHNR
ncbi:unnamed protein product [Cladocopium goreaui]|uniref:Uncharacterized protein n=1 Tax=Cladocopium goreaui TaxID=2562237 RepID=A0A9P1GSQ7_9DINO|nr:unnamed protein product [Cladocopium goreaui]